MPVISTIAAATARAFGAFKSLGGAADEFFDYVTLLLHGDGTNGAQNNTFLDSSTNNFTITRNGNTTQGTFSPFSQTGWSNYFDTSAYLSVASDLVGSTTSTFTVDGWVYLTATPTSSFEISAFCGLSGQGNGANNYMSFGPTSDSKITLRWFDGATKSAKSTTTLALNTWYYIACVVNSNAISMFINGVSETVTGTTTLTNRAGTATESYIGGKAHTYATLAGYISNVRVSSVARTITAQTAPFTSDANTTILTCKSNRFVDTSSSPKTLTIGGSPSVQAFSPFAPTAAYSAATVGGSGYFDGSGDYLSLADNAAFAMGTGNFTAEFWIYTQDQTNNYPGIISGSIYNDTGVISVRYDNTGHAKKIFVYLFGASPSDPAVTSSAYEFGQWIHVAIIRDSSTSLKVYVNGVLDGTATISAGQQVDFSGANSFYVGRGFDIDGNAGYYAGYISNVRLVKGQALASGNFTPPSAPVTSSAVGWTGANAAASITGTVSFVSNFTNGGIFDNTAKNVLETVGNAQISTSVKKFGTGSMYFDGTGDYLVLPPSPNLAFGTGDFTIEFWLNSSDGNANLIGITTNASGNWNLVLAGSSLYWQNQYSQANLYNRSATSILDGNWHHIAITRSSGTSRMFFDGVVQGASVSDTTSYVSAHNMQIGSSGVYGDINGYIDDLRITKGVARYTANFTPPIARMPNQ